MKKISTCSTLIFLLTLLAMGFPAAGQELGYRRITMKERLKAFYLAGGKTYLGKKVHIYIPAAVFKKKPKVITLPNGQIWHRYDNRSVPVLVSPINQYYKRLQTDLASKKKRAKIKTVSLYARVVRPAWDVKGRCHLLLHKTKTYGGALKKIGG